jgi:adenine-specific DNA methylase
MKPLPLIERAIRNSTDSGELVLDVFGGSGSTLIAAARTGRRSLLVEQAPTAVVVLARARGRAFRWGQLPSRHLFDVIVRAPSDWDLDRPVLSRFGNRRPPSHLSRYWDIRRPVQ